MELPRMRGMREREGAEAVVEPMVMLLGLVGWAGKGKGGWVVLLRRCVCLLVARRREDTLGNGFWE